MSGWSGETMPWVFLDPPASAALEDALLDAWALKVGVARERVLAGAAGMQVSPRAAVGVPVAVGGDLPPPPPGRSPACPHLLTGAEPTRLTFILPSGGRRPSEFEGR